VVRVAVSSTIEALEDRRLLSAEYYCNASAATNGTGTAASPWNQLHSISTFTGFKSGDVVNLTGVFNNQTLALQGADTGVTVTSNARNPAKISESPTYGFISAITVTTSGVTLSNLVLTGPGITADSNSYYGIWFQNKGTTQLIGATVDNVNITGFVFAGLQMDGNANAGFSNAVISNSTFSDNQVSGIFVDGSSTSFVNDDLTISNCVTSGNAGAAIWWNSNVQNATENSDNGGIYISSLDGALITHCTAIGNCYDSSGANGIWCSASEYVDIEYCESADTRTIQPTWDGGGFDLDNNTSYSILQYDYSHGNEGEGLFVCSFQSNAACVGDTIRYCISDDNGFGGRAGIELYCDPNYPVIGVNVYDNTILSTSGATGAFAVTGTGGCTANFLDNIVYAVNDPLINCSFVPPSLDSVNLEGNDYWYIGGATNFEILWGSGTYTSLSSFRTATGQETINGTPAGMNLDPMLQVATVSDLPIADIADFELSAGSPLIGAALNLATTPFSNSAPYNEYSPYNLGGSGWGGFGTLDYFGYSVNDGGPLNIGANASNQINLASGTWTVPTVPATSLSTTTLSSATIGPGAMVVVPGTEANHSTRTLTVLTSLTLAGTTNAWTGTLDLGDNDLIIQNGDLATITNQVSQGYTDQWQDDGGITSSAAALDTTFLTALGVIQNSATGSPSGPVLYSTFDGVASGDNDVLVKFTCYGDANLDGIIDGSDYSRIDNGAINQLTGWFNGDFNYDGVINGSDYTLIDNAYNTQGASLAAELAPAPSAAKTVGIVDSNIQSSAVPVISSSREKQIQPQWMNILAVNSRFIPPVKSQLQPFAVRPPIFTPAWLRSAAPRAKTEHAASLSNPVSVMENLHPLSHFS